MKETLPDGREKLTLDNYSGVPGEPWLRLEAYLAEGNSFQLTLRTTLNTPSPVGGESHWADFALSEAPARELRNFLNAFLEHLGAK